MEPEKGQEETLNVFFEAVGTRLVEMKDSDADLVNILKAHILKETPEHNAVNQAKDAIIKLARSRANSKKMEADNG